MNTPFPFILALSSLISSLAYAVTLALPLGLLFAVHDAAQDANTPRPLSLTLRALIAAFFPMAFLCVYQESQSTLVALSAPAGAFFLALRLLATLSIPPSETR